MQFYRIKVRLSGYSHEYIGLFAGSIEAVQQTLADWPWARGISVISLRMSARKEAA